MTHFLFTFLECFFWALVGSTIADILTTKNNRRSIQLFKNLVISAGVAFLVTLIFLV